MFKGVALCFWLAQFCLVVAHAGGADRGCEAVLSDKLANRLKLLLQNRVEVKRRISAFILVPQSPQGESVLKVLDKLKDAPVGVRLKTALVENEKELFALRKPKIRATYVVVQGSLDEVRKTLNAVIAMPEVIWAGRSPQKPAVLNALERFEKTVEGLPDRSKLSRDVRERFEFMQTEAMRVVVRGVGNIDPKTELALTKCGLQIESVARRRVLGLAGRSTLVCLSKLKTVSEILSYWEGNTEPEED